jgi:sec-independent protein translocase protein TatA
MLAIDPPGPWEIILILLLVLLIFGARKLPEIGKGLGKGIREFRDATKGIADDVKSGMEDEEKPSEPTAKDDRSQGGPPPGR